MRIRERMDRENKESENRISDKNIQGLPVSSENAWLTAGGRTQENSGTDPQERSFRESRVCGGRRLKQSGGKPHNLWGWARRWGRFHQAWRFGLTPGFLRLHLPKFWRLELSLLSVVFRFFDKWLLVTVFVPSRFKGCPWLNPLWAPSADVLVTGVTGAAAG